MIFVHSKCCLYTVGIGRWHALCSIQWTHHDRVLAVVLHNSDLLGQHSQLLKVDQPTHLRLVAIVQKGKVFLNDGKERDERW